MSIASEQASRFSTRRPDFEGEQEAAFADWLFTRALHFDEAEQQIYWRAVMTATTRWEQWEHTHKVAA